MISINNLGKCCGCSACVQICPKQCISFKENEEGFLYPHVDTSMCINCDLCEKVCVLNQSRERRNPLRICAAINKHEETRILSSSGGIFTLLAEMVVDTGGVVFGARFDKNWEVQHDYTENKEGLATFRCSKYVESRMEDNYQKVAIFLKQGRKVMFTGTPCQIVGLKSFLRKEYDNLLTVDFFCHGVPSPKIWRMYLNETCKKMTNNVKKSITSIQENNKRDTFCIEAINFRNKNFGWKKYSFFLSVYWKEGGTVQLCEPRRKNIFMRGFISNLYLRPSCYQCVAKSGKSNSDITIADFWGIRQILPLFDDGKGTSLVLLNTTKGNDVFSSLDVKVHFVSSKSIQDGFYKSASQHPKRTQFFKECRNCTSISEIIDKYSKIPIYLRIFRKFRRGIRKFKMIIDISNK